MVFMNALRPARAGERKKERGTPPPAIESVAAFCCSDENDSGENRCESRLVLGSDLAFSPISNNVDMKA
jgi:hypothetical protein